MHRDRRPATAMKLHSARIRADCATKGHDHPDIGEPAIEEMAHDAPT
ncbi:hypothetical protein [Micromonospora sp. WMMD1082]|nr:hypothetical protein [Micromonospora sp. WMMD1082]MDG4795516.1 hypothetical protein [Micromonospora sp. WMMD1082]